MSSNYGDILNSCLSGLRGLSFTDLDAANVILRKLPKASETLDTLPLCVVAPSETPEQVTPLSFEDNAAVSVVYSVDVAFIADDNHDFASNIDKYMTWREQARQLFQTQELVGVPSVYKIEIKPFSPLDRAHLNQNYAYSGLSLWIHAVEKRS